MSAPELSLEALIEERSLKVAIKFARKKRVCPKCESRLTMHIDIVSFTKGPASHFRLVIYCMSPRCDWWLALLESLPSGFRIEPSNNNPHLAG